jgi:hypothetical protein
MLILFMTFSAALLRRRSILPSHSEQSCPKTPSSTLPEPRMPRHSPNSHPQPSRTRLSPDRSAPNDSMPARTPPSCLPHNWETYQWPYRTVPGLAPLPLLLHSYVQDAGAAPRFDGGVLLPQQVCQHFGPHGSGAAELLGKDFDEQPGAGGGIVVVVVLGGGYGDDKGGWFGIGGPTDRSQIRMCLMSRAKKVRSQHGLAPSKMVRNHA